MALFVNNGKRYYHDIQTLLVYVKVGVVSTDEGFVELCCTAKGLCFVQALVIRNTMTVTIQ